MEESYAGPHADMLVSQSAGFPLKYVGWSLPGLAWGLRSDRQALEIQAAQGSGVTDTFTASESGSDYYIKNVSVQRLGLSYGYRMFRPVQLNLGLSTTTLNFSSSARSFEYIYPAAFAGLGWDTKIEPLGLMHPGDTTPWGRVLCLQGCGFYFK